MKKTKKRNYLVIVLVVLLLAIAVGYAAFSSTLTITGTATAKGDWDVHFVPSEVSITKSPTTIDASITETGDSSQTVTVKANFTEPGQSAQFSIPVENKGSTTAKVTGLKITAKDGSSANLTGTNDVFTYGVIKASLNTASFATGNTLAKDEKKNYTLTLEWPSENDSSSNVDDEMTFTIELTYGQNV